MEKQNGLDLLLKSCIYCFVLTFIIASGSLSSASDGLSFESQYLHPGKADFHYLHTETTDEFNTIWWSPVFKGGTGYVDLDSGGSTKYSGGYFRPLLPKDGKGELIFGFNEVNTNTAYGYEIQGEYRFPFGLGIGGGSVSRDGLETLL